MHHDVTSATSDPVARQQRVGRSTPRYISSLHTRLTARPLEPSPYGPRMFGRPLEARHWGPALGSPPPPPNGLESAHAAPGWVDSRAEAHHSLSPDAIRCAASTSHPPQSSRGDLAVLPAREVRAATRLAQGSPVGGRGRLTHAAHIGPTRRFTQP